MTELVKNVMREQFEELSGNLSEEQEHELYNSETYKLTTEQLVDQLIATYDGVDFIKVEYAEAILNGFDQAIESTIITKDLEEDIFGVEQFVLDYFDRLVEALKIVKDYYASKLTVA